MQAHFPKNSWCHAQRACVAEALRTLPPDYRLALVSRYVDECSVAEVARLLGKNYKATESVLSRARAAFREAVDRLEGREQNGRFRAHRQPGWAPGLYPGPDAAVAGIRRLSAKRPDLNEVRSFEGLPMG
jgi:hypothetical protein